MAELIDEVCWTVTGVHIDPYGSLAATGAGHGTMSAALKGLCGLFRRLSALLILKLMIRRNSVDGTCRWLVTRPLRTV